MAFLDGEQSRGPERRRAHGRPRAGDRQVPARYSGCAAAELNPWDTHGVSPAAFHSQYMLHTLVARTRKTVLCASAGPA